MDEAGGSSSIPSAQALCWKAFTHRLFSSFSLSSIRGWCMHLLHAHVFSFPFSFSVFSLTCLRRQCGFPAFSAITPPWASLGHCVHSNMPVAVHHLLSAFHRPLSLQDCRDTVSKVQMTRRGQDRAPGFLWGQQDEASMGNFRKGECCHHN